MEEGYIEAGVERWGKEKRKQKKENISTHITYLFIYNVFH